LFYFHQPGRNRLDKQEQRNMNSSIRQAHHLGYWLLGITILIAFGLVDAAMVAVPARALTFNQLFAGAMAFVLMAGGLLFTVWSLED
jgi:hypothetical protein